MNNLHKISILIIVILFACLIQSCRKKVVPVVETGSITNITGSSATCEGTVTDEGSSALYTRGVCWSVDPSPTIDGSFTNNGTGLGTYISNMTKLDGSTKYFVRAYATNDDGTGYGNEVTFSTAPRNIIFNPDIKYGSITDRDGNIYRTVKIGDQTWMAENLRTTHYQDGSEIPNVTDPVTWAGLTTGGFCYYDNDTLNRHTYGALYNWFAVGDQRKICPTGWHVSSDAEWTVLENSLGGSTYAGMKMKEVSQIHWASPNIGATNESGFTAVPGGARYWSFQNDFYNLEYFSVFWTATEAHTDAQSAWIRYISYNGVDVGRDTWWKITGFSLRCVKD